MEAPELDAWFMQRALELAAQGRGHVEPNPMVGCTIVQNGELIAEGWHRAFGAAHAEIDALAQAGRRARGATMYVTLEPCRHTGKTPPCTEAILAAGLARVVVAQRDPFPAVDGAGLAELAAAGVAVEVGLLEPDARRLNAPYLKLLETGRPWMIAKWAMTLDGKIASTSGDSRWISGESSRALVHALRGRVDAVLVGAGTVAADDPLLTARPPGSRTATRVVLDTHAALGLDRQLVRTAADAPVLIATAEDAPASAVERLRQAGCEVFPCPGGTHAERLDALLNELGRRRMTNVLVEGGSQLLGSLFDADGVDEVHAFMAPRLVGGRAAPTPIAGEGRPRIDEAIRFSESAWRMSGDDLYFTGRVARD